MSTITSLSFDITSSWDGKGVRAAAADLDKLKASIDAVNGKDVNITINDAAAKASIDELKKDIDSVSNKDVKVTLDDAAAKATVDDLKKDLDSVSNKDVKVTLDDAAAKATVDDLKKDLDSVSNKDVKVTLDDAAAKAKVAEIKSSLDSLTSQKLSLDLDDARAKAEIASIDAQIKSLSSVRASVDMDDAAAKAKINELKLQLDALRDKRVEIKADTLGAVAKIKELKLYEDTLRDKEISVKADTSQASSALHTVADNLAKLPPLVGAVATAAIAAAPAMVTLAQGALAVGGATVSAFGLAAAAVAPFGLAMFGTYKTASTLSGQLETLNNTLTNQQAKLASLTPGTAAYKSQVQAINGTQQQMNTLMQQAGPAATTVAQGMMKVQDSFHAFQAAAFPLTQPIFTGIFSTITASLPKMIPLVAAVAPLFQAIVDKMQAFAQGNGFNKFVQFVIANGVPVLHNLISLVMNLGEFLVKVTAAFAPLAISMTGWLAKVTAELNKWVDGGGLQRFIALVESHAPQIKQFLEGLAGTVARLTQALSRLGPVGLSSIGLLLQLTSHLPVAAVEALYYAFLAYKALTFVSGLIDGIAVALDFLAANPIIAIVIGIAALVAAIVLIATKTRWFQDIWDSAWHAVKQAFDIVWGAIKGAAETVWHWMENTWRTTWDHIKGVVEPIWNWLKSNWKLVVEVIATLSGGVLGLAIALIATHWTETKQKVEGVWNWLKSTWRTVVDAFKTAWDTVSSALKSAWDAFWNGLKSAAEAVWNAIKSAWSTAINALKGVWDTVSGALSAAWSSVWNAMKSAAQAVWTAIQAAWTTAINTIKSIWDSVSGALSAAWSAVWNAMKSAGQAVWTAIQAAWTAVVNALKSAWDTVSSALTAAWNTVWNALKTAAQAVWTAMQAAWQTFLNTVKSIWDSVSSALTSAWNTVWNALKTAAQAVWTAMQAAWQTFLNTVKSIWDTVSSALTAAWNTVWNTIKAAGQAIWTAMQAAWQTFLNTVKSIWDTVSSALQSAWSSAWNTVKSVVTGIWNDIQNAWNTFTGVISSGVQTLVNTVKGIWDGIVDVFRNPINLVIRVWNDVAGAIGLPKIPEIPKMNGGGPVPAGGAITGANGAAPGPVRAFADGGHVFGKGSGTSDEIPVWLSNGEYVMPAKTVEHYGMGIMEAMRARKLAQGGPVGHDGGAQGYSIGGAISHAVGNVVHAGSNVVGAITSAASSAFDALKNIAATVVYDTAKPILDGIVSAIPHPVKPLGSPYGDLPHSAAQKAEDGVLSLFKKKQDAAKAAAAAIGGSIPTGMHLQVLTEGINAAKEPLKSTLGVWIAGMNTLITRESGWNPNAVNRTDSNAKAGHPSQGLCQVIPSTFAAYHAPGTSTNILDPVANIAAAVRYIVARYGDITKVQQANANLPPKGYASGTSNARRGWAMVGEKGPEVVHFGGGEVVKSFDETMAAIGGRNSAGTKAIVEAIHEAGGGGDINLTMPVTITGTTTDTAQDLADRLEADLVPKLNMLLTQKVGARR